MYYITVGELDCYKCCTDYFESNLLNVRDENGDKMLSSLAISTKLVIKDSDE